MFSQANGKGKEYEFIVEKVIEFSCFLPEMFSCTGAQTEMADGAKPGDWRG